MHYLVIEFECAILDYIKHCLGLCPDFWCLSPHSHPVAGDNIMPPPTRASDAEVRLHDPTGRQDDYQCINSKASLLHSALGGLQSREATGTWHLEQISSVCRRASLAWISWKQVPHPESSCFVSSTCAQMLWHWLCRCPGQGRVRPSADS